MGKGYKAVYKGGAGEIEEKKSRFICAVEPASSEEDAIAFFNRKKKEYWDARHNCTAFTIGENNEISRCSDDGEPPGTAGRPMLDILLGEGIHYAAVVVTRYFGGTLLGTGGLIRAYQRAVREGLANATIIERQKGMIIKIRTGYASLGKIQYALSGHSAYTLETDYADAVNIRAIAPDDAVSALRDDILRASNGAAGVEDDGAADYCIADGKVIMF